MYLAKLHRFQSIIRPVGFLAIMLLFAGCQPVEYAVPASNVAALSGSVHGGNLPISGSSVQLYAAGATGDGSPAKPLLTKAVQTGPDGSFSISGDYTCPTAATEVYIVATGGVSHFGGRENRAISLMTVLGPCGQLTTSSSFEINEVTTVAAVWGLRGYMSSISVLGAPASDGAFIEDVTKEQELVNVTTGTSPGTTVPNGYVVQAGKLYALADIMAACVNSNGGVAGDGSPCGNLFASVQRPSSGIAPTETIGAALAIAHFPTVDVERIYSLMSAPMPFSPTISTAPSDWALSLLELPSPPVIFPSTGTYAAGQQVSLSTNSSGAIIHYTVDGSQPTTNSPVYATPFKLTGSETVRAVCVENGLASVVASTTYTVTMSHLVFATQPSNGIVSHALSPAPAIEVIDDLSGKLVTSSTLPVTIRLSANPGHTSLTGSTTLVPVNGIATFPNLNLAEPSNGYSLEATASGLPSIVSNTFNISDAKLSLSVSNASPSVGTSSTGIVTLSAPLLSATTISLSSSSSSNVSIAPSSLTIPAGSTFGSFTYKAATLGVSILNATATNYTAGSAQVTVVPDPVISVSLPNASPTVGMISTGMVTLSAPATSAVTLSLTSNSPTLLSITPATLAIPAGASSGTFTYSASAAGPAIVSVTATNYTAGSAMVMVAPDPVIAVSLANAAPTVGMTVTGTVTLSEPAVSAVNLSLTSSSPTVASISPALLMIAAGASSGTFSYTALAVGSSTISATAPLYIAGSVAVSSVPGAPVIPSTLFGLTVLNYYNLNPTPTYGTTRTWDSYPNLDWSDANPTPGVYQFEWLDHFIALNQARGTDIIYTLGRTPQWASSQPNAAGAYGPGQCAAPSNMSYYDAYLTALVTHEKGNIKFYELWNEPQTTDFYCGTIQQMVTMAQHAAQIVKSIDPNAQIISPGVTGGPGPAWLSSFLAAGGSSYVDGISFHGYWSASAEDLITVVNSYKSAMAANGVANLPMFDTEASWAGFGNLGIPSTTTQVSYVAKTYLLHWSEGVSRFVWYAYDGGSIWGGLLTAAGTESAAGTSYKQVYSWMVGASMSTPCTQASNGVYTCRLTRSGGYSAIAVWTPNSTGTYLVPAGFNQYRDLTGVVHPINGNAVTIQDQPILLESGNIP